MLLFIAKGAGHAAASRWNDLNLVICGQLKRLDGRRNRSKRLLVAVAVELDSASLLGKCFAPDTTPVSLPRNELLDQERMLRKRLCGLNKILRNQIRHFVPETQNRRRFDSYQGTFRADNVLQQFHVADRQLLRIAQETLGNLCAAAVHVVWNDDLVAQ